MCHHTYKVGQVVRLKAQNTTLEIFALGSTKDMNVPVYFVRPTDGHGAIWGLCEHEIEAHD